MLKIRVTGHGGHINLKLRYCESGPADSKIFSPRDTKQAAVLLTNTPPPPTASLSLCSCLASVFERDHHSFLFSFMPFSPSLSLSLWLSRPVSQSIFHSPIHYPPLSHSPAAPTHSVTLVSPQTISLAITLRKLELLFLPSSPPFFFFFFALPSARAPFLARSLKPYLPFPLSISSAQRRGLLPQNASRQLKADASCASQAARARHRRDASQHPEKPHIIKTALKCFVYPHLQCQHNFNLFLFPFSRRIDPCGGQKI